MRNRHRKFNLPLFLSLVMVIVFLIIFIMMSDMLGKRTTADQEASLEHALDHAITNCYALEGMYPPDLDYMKDHYGLIYDESLFYVDYRPIASNIRPDYFIIRRDEAQ